MSGPKRRIKRSKSRLSLPLRRLLLPQPLAHLPFMRHPLPVCALPTLIALRQHAARPRGSHASRRASGGRPASRLLSLTRWSAARRRIGNTHFPHLHHRWPLWIPFPTGFLFLLHPLPLFLLLCQLKSMCQPVQVLERTVQRVSAAKTRSTSA